LNILPWQSQGPGKFYEIIVILFYKGSPKGKWLIGSLPGAGFS